MDIANAVEILEYATLLRKENLVIKTQNEWLKRALSDIEDWCVEFHVTGPHDPEKALKIVMNIYDIAHEQLGDRTEELKCEQAK
jgi:hypothetical protein